MDLDDGVEVTIEDDYEVVDIDKDAKSSRFDLSVEQTAVLVKKQAISMKCYMEFLLNFLKSSKDISLIILDEVSKESKILFNSHKYLTDFATDFSAIFGQLNASINDSFKKLKLVAFKEVETKLSNVQITLDQKTASIRNLKGELIAKEIQTDLQCKHKLAEKMKNVSEADEAFKSKLVYFVTFKDTTEKIIDRIIDPETHSVQEVDLDVYPLLLDLINFSTDLNDLLKLLLDAITQLVQEFEIVHEILSKSIKNMYNNMKDNLDFMSKTLSPLDFSQFEKSHNLLETLTETAKECINEKFKVLKLGALRSAQDKSCLLNKINMFNISKFSSVADLNKFLLEVVDTKFTLEDLEVFSVDLKRKRMASYDDYSVRLTIQRNVLFYQKLIDKLTLIKAIKQNNLNIEVIDENSQVVITKVRDTDFFSAAINLVGGKQEISKILSLI